MNYTSVSVVPCRAYEDVKLTTALRKSLQLIGGFPSFLHEGDTVLVKPNLCYFPPDKPATITDVRVIVKLVQELYNARAGEVIVAENNVFMARYLMSENREAIENVGGKVLDLSKEPQTSIYNENGVTCKQLSVPALMKEVDTFISMPKMKTHLLTEITLGLKNQLGFLYKGPELYSAHNSAIYDKIVDVNQCISPNLVIIDGVEGMEGQGPTYGYVKKSGVLVAGTDSYSTDIIASRIMGFNPQSMPLFEIAKKRGLNKDKNVIRLFGTDLREIMTPFKKASLQLSGVHRNFRCLIGDDTCIGCRFITRLVMDFCVVKKVADFLPKTTLVLGKFAERLSLPESENLIIVGDCAINSIGEIKGRVFDGCPPLKELTDWVVGYVKNSLRDVLGIFETREGYTSI